MSSRSMPIMRLGLSTGNIIFCVFRITLVFWKNKDAKQNSVHVRSV